MSAFLWALIRTSGDQGAKVKELDSETNESSSKS